MFDSSLIDPYFFCKNNKLIYLRHCVRASSQTYLSISVRAEGSTQIILGRFAHSLVGVRFMLYIYYVVLGTEYD